MLNKTILTSAVGVALLCGTAFASSYENERHEYYERRGPMPFEVLDLNRDGVVTPEEHAQVRSERQKVRSEQGYPMRNAASAPSFDQIDTDGDGAISRNELYGWQAGRMQQRPGMGPAAQ